MTARASPICGAPDRLPPRRGWAGSNRIYRAAEPQVGANRLNRLQVFLILIGLLVLRPAFAADLSILDYSVEGKNRYDRCLELIKRDPAVANDQADGWVKTGGGAAALHCQGLALVELKRSDAAAAKFEQAAHDHGLANPAERAALLDQAGNAWLLAGKPDKA